MPVNVMSTLQAALRQLEGEKARIDRQIEALQRAIGGVGGRRPAAVKGMVRRRRMSAAARRAASQRMKAYWAKRKSAGGNGKARKAKPK
jgi:hypothetical protein